MENELNRLKVLISETIQVLEHMKVDSKNNGLLQQIISDFKEKHSNLDGNHLDGNFQVDELKKLVLQLEENLLVRYKSSTNIDEYEKLSIEDQQKQEQNYHNKIDYLSAVKTKENLEEINDLVHRLKS